jgi:hypothetical protein
MELLNFNWTEDSNDTNMKMFTSKLAKLRQAKNGGGLHNRKESAPGAGSHSRRISNLEQI